jgi:peptidylprolyl isomerase
MRPPLPSVTFLLFAVAGCATPGGSVTPMEPPDPAKQVGARATLFPDGGATTPIAAAEADAAAPTASEGADAAELTVIPSTASLLAARPAEPSMVPAPADVKRPPSDADVTPSGLASKVLVRGKGSRRPKLADSVRVHYTGWTTDGRMFDSSVVRGEPAVFPLAGVIKGWTEGLQLMVEGEKRRFWIPASLAYGTSPAAGRPAGMLVFDVELLQIER